MLWLFPVLSVFFHETTLPKDRNVVMTCDHGMNLKLVGSQSARVPVGTALGPHSRGGDACVLIVGSVNETFKSAPFLR